VLVWAIAVFGCSPANPESVANLSVDSSGTYTLNGRVVSEARLVQELQALQGPGARVALEIWAAPDANHQAVSRAVVAAQSAKIAGIRFVTQQSK
jgi:biopolymer transport protein ExbD